MRPIVVKPHIVLLEPVIYRRRPMMGLLNVGRGKPEIAAHHIHRGVAEQGL
jgi:hypothetical protein